MCFVSRCDDFVSNGSTFVHSQIVLCCDGAFCVPVRLYCRVPFSIVCVPDFQRLLVLIPWSCKLHADFRFSPIMPHVAGLDFYDNALSEIYAAL